MHRLKPEVKINRTYYCDIWRHMLLPDIRSASGREFFLFFSRTVLLRTKDKVALRDARFYPTCQPQPGWLNRVECASGTSLSYQDLGCRRIESWNDASTASGPHWVTGLVNVLLESGVSTYPIALMLDADVLSTRCNNDDMTCVTFWETL